MSRSAHEVVSEQYPWYARPGPVDPLTKLHVVFLCYVMTEQVFHPGPAASRKTQD